MLASSLVRTGQRHKAMQESMMATTKQTDTAPPAAQTLAEAPRPWWLRLLVWLGRVLVRRPLP